MAAFAAERKMAGGPMRRAVASGPRPSGADMALLRIGGLTRSFYGVQALKGLDLEVAAGTITGLIGPNGAGKTTAFNVISGLVPPDAGRISFDGRDITGWRPDRITGAGLVRTF